MSDVFVINGLNSYAIVWLAVGAAGFMWSVGVSLVISTYWYWRRR